MSKTLRQILENVYKQKHLKKMLANQRHMPEKCAKKYKTYWYIVEATQMFNRNIN